jgi:hypothetical protein
MTSYFSGSPDRNRWCNLLTYTRKTYKTSLTDSSCRLTIGGRREEDKEEATQMKLLAASCLTILIFLVLAAPSLSQGKKNDISSGADQVSEKKDHPVNVPPKAEKAPLLRAKVKTMRSFSGTVTGVNLVDKTITLRNRGLLVTFDAGNPALTGYKGLGEVKVGHTVSASYTETGLSLRREGGKAVEPEEKALKPRKEVRKPRQEATRPKQEAAKPNRLVRVVTRGKGSDFDVVDENQDGRITAAELSVIIPNLTRDQFKEYDGNGDGWLNRAEFEASKR